MDKRVHLTFSICISFLQRQRCKDPDFKICSSVDPSLLLAQMANIRLGFPDLIQQHFSQQWWWTSFHSELLELNWKIHRATWELLLDVFLSASIWNKPHSSSHLPSVGKDPPWTTNCLCCSQSGAALGQFGQQFLCAVCVESVHGGTDPSQLPKSWTLLNSPSAQSSAQVSPSSTWQPENKPLET